jgi:hypothetical protein
MKTKILIRLAVVALIFAGPGLLHAATPLARIHSVQPNYTYGGEYTSLERVDFRNLEYGFFVADAGQPYQAARLVDGSYETADDESSEAIDLVAVHLIPGDNGAARFAIVELQEHTCEVACSDWGEVAVFRLDRTRLVEIQEIWFEDHDGGSDFNAAQQVLMLQATARGNGEDEDLDLATYRWTGSAFELSSLETPDGLTTR